eukprot:CAMPEP_0174287258 /NCGR_PEP_ID=MMETSP0809-20121228/15087_1 /TAXON_ID=73025 ORGANISM="Eutreptiella gymnastica-like, Strain CCMP1594" /NCGR_SAMPLE_ID=MMETSP0809 /ASSEMBLY_ACC=CAM_ASM_000658 /LENGTH=232 /DNA_ID=CAMNT_0015383723 /DNA_START=18 /DNA_END=713 /DNA_ORIENTATION=+
MNQQGPIQTTEWSDIQYKFGNKVGKYADPELEQKILEQRLKQTVDDFVENFNPNDYKTLEEVEAELEESYDDDRELERLRAQRIAEMQQQAQAPSFGVVRRIEKSDYVAQVNNAGDGIPVVLLLMLPQHHDCLRLKRSFEEIAAKHMGTKFLEIISTECIPNFPERQLPCVIIYKDGSLVKQLTGLNSWGGEKFTTDDVLYELHKMGVVNDADVAADLQDKDAQQEPNLKSW